VKLLKIFVINGYPGSGKDEFVKLCMKHSTKPVVNYVTSTPAKLALRLLGWRGKEKTPQIRKALADLMELSESLFNGVIGATEAILLKAMQDYGDNCIVFIHCREPRNIDYYRKKHDAITIFIDRNKARKKGFSNKSDAYVEKYNYDLVIENNESLQVLEQAAIEFLKGM
jgi:hypothetical protein